MKRISARDAASQLGISYKDLRLRMRRGELKIGKCIAGDKGYHTYLIYQELLDEQIREWGLNGK